MNRRRLLSFLGIATAAPATFVYRSGDPAGITGMGANFFTVGPLTESQCDELRAAWTKYSDAKTELVNGQQFVLRAGELFPTDNRNAA